VVERTLDLDNVFSALANQYRRDILRRAATAEQTSGRLSQIYGITIAAVAKHFGVLEHAGLIRTEKRGKERFARLAPAGLKDAAGYLDYYERFWNGQLDALEAHLERTIGDA
jgi:DNA-binding transcriptional ArsR family regulator